MLVRFLLKKWFRNLLFSRDFFFDIKEIDWIFFFPIDLVSKDFGSNILGYFKKEELFFYYFFKYILNN